MTTTMFKHRCRRIAAAHSLVVLASVLAGTHAFAASVNGRVVNAAGEPLDKVPVCLQTSAADLQCSKLRSTDRQGRYSFKGLKPGSDYRVAVFQDNTAAGRKFDRYRTYVWEPVSQAADITRKNDSLQIADFTGKFNFSNFQRGLTLTASDFPEMSSIDLLAEYVILKVFLQSQDPSVAPETIFLGQVTNTGAINITVSVPLAATSIQYQIYSASLSIDGSISLNES